MDVPLSKLRIWVAIAAAMVVGWAVSRFSGVPAFGEFSGSLLQQHSPAWAILAVLVTVVATLGITTPLAASANREAPIGCAALALMVFSWRGGRMYFCLAGHDSTVYLWLALEVVILFVILLVCWLAWSRLVRCTDSYDAAASQIDPARLDELNDDPRQAESVDQSLVGTLSHALVCAGVLYLACRTDQKMQASLSVLLASWLAALTSHRFVPTRPAVWFWMAPLLVALLAYVTGYFSGAGLAIGEPQHYFAAQARALPLDYASAGVAGAIWGYSARRRHQIEKLNPQPADPSQSPAAS